MGEGEGGARVDRAVVRVEASEPLRGQRSCGRRAAAVSSRREAGVSKGALAKNPSSRAASASMSVRASMKASSVSFDSVSVG